MIDYKDLKMKCVTTNPQEPFFTEGKEYQIFYESNEGYFIKDDDGDTVDYGKTRGELLTNLNEYWYSQFELAGLIRVCKAVEIEEDSVIETIKELLWNVE